MTGYQLTVKDGSTLLHLLAYVDLNPIRAAIVRRPEEYRWCSMGYHLQTGYVENLLSLEFGADWNEDEPQEIVRKYRSSCTRWEPWIPAQLNAAELPCPAKPGQKEHMGTSYLLPTA